jgi:hypothetical protein
MEIPRGGGLVVSIVRVVRVAAHYLLLAVLHGVADQDG